MSASANQPVERSDRVRLFRADTPHDVASACLVARLSPGRDYLAISADKAAGDPADYLPTMRAVAGAHPWIDIVDVSGLPISEHDWFVPDARSRRIDLYRDMRRSFRMLDATLAERLSQASIEELFVTRIDHPDIQLMSQVLADARVSVIPHGFGGIREAENETSVRLTARPSVWRRARHALSAVLKRPIWGMAATPPISFEVDASYSFNCYPAFGGERHDLTSLMKPDSMQQLFAALPTEVRREYELAGAGGPVGLLLLVPSEDRGRDYPHEREVEGFAHLASQLVARHSVVRIVIKPHPRNGAQRVLQVADAIRRELPDVDVTVIEEYPGVPMEIAAGAMNIAAAAGLGSTAVQTLAGIYHIPTYSSDRLLRELNAYDPKWTSWWEGWMRANRGSYTSV